MKQGLNNLKRLLELVTDTSIPSEVKESEVASWIVNDALQFVNEVSAGIEALETITTLSNQALQKGGSANGTTT